MKTRSNATRVSQLNQRASAIVVIGGIILSGCQHRPSKSLNTGFQECYDKGVQAYSELMEAEGSRPVSASNIARRDSELRNIRDRCASSAGALYHFKH